MGIEVAYLLGRDSSQQTKSGGRRKAEYYKLPIIYVYYLQSCLHYCPNL